MCDQEISIDARATKVLVWPRRQCALDFLPPIVKTSWIGISSVSKTGYDTCV